MNGQRKDKTPAGGNGFEKLPFRVHPRVFESLGNDLVTDDIVAVIELVKNSYDALAINVRLKFDENESYGRYLEIEDDGHGMTREVLENVWCLVATPFKAQNPMAKSEKNQRRVVGNKGLGRLSALRLGGKLRMLTQAKNSPCWQVDVDWSTLSKTDSLSEGFVVCAEYPEESPFSETGSGTRLTVYDLNSRWEENRISELRENLARLVSPFSQVDEFNISLVSREGFFDRKIKIDAPEFLDNPKYLMRGRADGNGNVRAEYRFAPVSSEGIPREKPIEKKWMDIHGDNENDRHIRIPTSSSPEKARCGPFDFEIRAWDIAGADTEEIANRFNLKKSHVRKAIRAHRGISIYRDGILVLPKSDKTRDWLDLDLRRVSRVGTRMSTNQIIGYVSISAERNPAIKDTSDRERLVSRDEVAEFEAIMKTAVTLLENERDLDKRERDKEEQKTDLLFDRLSAKDLRDEIAELSKRGKPASEAVPSIEKHAKNLEEAKKTLQKRFVYYSRLATIGAIASMLVHEIRNQTTVIGDFLDSFEKHRESPNGKLTEEHRMAVEAVNSLEHLSDTFLPLASRNFRRGNRRGAILEEHIKGCAEIRREAMEKTKIECRVPESETPVAVDPGELDAIILNLLQNAEYWLGKSGRREEVDFHVERIDEGRRVRVSVHDTGPGIEEEDIEKIFWPGVTRKPNGIGMGLTVASELVSAYGGDMSTIRPGVRGGASFVFDLPVQG